MILFLVATFLLSCGKESIDQGQGSNDFLWTHINDFLYQLQEIDLNAVAQSKFDLVIIDYSRDGTEANKFTAGEIAYLKNSPGGPKKVMAYLSIGEAENYRFYWNSDWDSNQDGYPDAKAPNWLGPMNPDWPGNYKVRYWDPEWQSLLFGNSDSYLDKIIDAGFDGVYLDLIDAYEYWGVGGESGLNRSEAALDMVSLVKKIAEYAQNVKGKRDFGVTPQNGEGLSIYPDYLSVITGIGKEDVWYYDTEAQDSSVIGEVLEHLDRVKNAGKLVLVIDYVTRSDLVSDFYQKARTKGYVPYATTRELNQMTIHSGFEPD